MTKTRLVLAALALVLIAGGFVLGLTPATSTEAVADTCPAFWLNSQEWGMASTCQGAINACYSRALTQAENFCTSLGKDICSLGAFTHNACYQAGGQWKTDCNLQYNCERGPLQQPL